MLFQKFWETEQRRNYSFVYEFITSKIMKTCNEIVWEVKSGLNMQYTLTH